PVCTELLDHELAERVIQISGIPGASLRLAFRGQSVQVCVLHEEPRRLLPRPPRGVHHDRRDVPAVAKKRVLQLRELQPKVAESVLDHRMLALVSSDLRVTVRTISLILHTKL